MEKKELSTGELIELARACMERGDCFNCVLYNTQKCEDVLMLSLADKLEELCERWVPAAEAKPAEADEYLVMVAGAKKPTTLWYDSDEEMFYEEYGDETVWYPVTHWAELPGAPTKANEVVFSDRGGREAVCSRKQGDADLLPPPARRRCATCAHEDKLAECDRCIACEKHNLWEQR